jgi:hypothetical protein
MPDQNAPAWWQQPKVLIAFLAGAVVIIVVLVITVIVLATGNESAKTSTASSTRTYTPYVPTSTPTVAPAGPSGLGEPVTLENGGVETLTYSVTSIEVDGHCPDRAYNPIEHGHLLVVGLDVQTASGYRSDFNDVLSPYKGGWSIVGADGITETGITSAAAYGCADAQIPRSFAANQHYVYKVAFDTRNTTGTLHYRVGSADNSWRY